MFRKKPTFGENAGVAGIPIQGEYTCARSRPEAPRNLATSTLSLCSYSSSSKSSSDLYFSTFIQAFSWRISILICCSSLISYFKASLLSCFDSPSPDTLKICQTSFLMNSSSNLSSSLMSGYDLFILPRMVLNLFLTMCSVLLLSNSLAIFDHFLPFSISKAINLLSSAKFHSPLYKIKNTDSWMGLSDSTISTCIAFLTSSTTRWIANKVASPFRSICL